MANTVIPISQATSSRASSSKEPSSSLGDFTPLWTYLENGTQDLSNLGDFGDLWRFLQGEKEKWCNSGTTPIMDFGRLKGLKEPATLEERINAKTTFKFRVPIPIKISEDPIHIFVDNSNILAGFMAYCRQQQNLRRTQNPRTILGKRSNKKPMLEYEALFTILERGRNVARRVLVASSPLYQQLDKAEEAVSTQFEMEKEQCVDELLHLKILESLLDYKAPATLVLASGDGKDAEYFQGGFHKCIIKALERGWKVEVISWQQEPLVFLLVKEMWSCLNKCPCFHFRSESQPPFDQYYDDEDNLEFEHLLAQQDAESIAAFLSRAPFSRSTNTPNYFGRTNPVLPNEEASASENRLLLDDDENLPTQDAQFLPDEQITAKVAQAKGLIPDEQTNTTNNIFTIEDEDGDEDGKNHTDSSNTVYSMNDDVEMSDDSQIESYVDVSQIEEENEQNESSLNKPRNAHERIYSKDVNLEDYEDVNDFEDTSNYDRRSSDSSLERNRSRRSIIRDIETRRKIEEDYSPFSVGILQSDNFDDYYSPIVATPTTNTFRGELGNHYFEEEEEEIDHPFANILPNFSERLDKSIRNNKKLVIQKENKNDDKENENEENDDDA
ncbi:4097_t:CDS:10 [Diversispora eburnea]|uniref:4097_t:CDS:1 n=1 Tax=Diversispora eburnea TaxID=1213867 RepID=A0A9N9C0J0_9GLOM|nr:4097_t:CDS:10 [Diversispora eburnea]